uniref:ATP synthase CF1 subunit delta n=1 Tax=Dicranema revolutum TaxID=239144 RepID=A0A4D6WSW5_9FLOR|nr:ATP synthase CF1 subunit delta [Dicranema revolutum]
MSNQNLIAKAALPYAEALLDYSKEKQLINDISKNLSSIADLLSQSVELQLLLSNPLITAETKKNIINTLWSTQVNDFLLKLLLVLVDRRRINLLNLIIDKYFDLVYKLDATIVAKVISSITLTEVQQEDLIKKLKGMTNSKNVKLELIIDTNLIGGFIIQLGSKIIDTSLSGKLKQMSMHLNTN